jgi:hypothetical protein
LVEVKRSATSLKFRANPNTLKIMLTYAPHFLVLVVPSVAHHIHG